MVADVGTPAPETPLTVTSTADVASAIESALRSYDGPWRIVFGPYDHTTSANEPIASLARHIAAALKPREGQMLNPYTPPADGYQFTQGFNGA